ncbi:MAG TPA: CoA transferase [Acetobacteraceae bacterium]|nr:CoA transferase [Acetobacteraceae bacterium]
MPLADVTVLDFGQIYQGSYATLLLAKAGANVIKIEPPGGEPLRRRTPPGAATTLPFAMLNANKRAITLNLKTPRGRDLLFDMARRADVLLENFAPGTMDALGTGWAVLQAVNSRLIYASATGYGLSGPNRGSLAMDLTVQAASGILSVTGFPDGPPVRAGVTVADFMGGIHAYGGILTALYERERSGVGRLVEIAMQEAVYFTLAAPMEQYRRSGVVPPRTGNSSGGSVTPFGVYPVRDGYVAIHTGTDQHWLNILDAAGRGDLKGEPRFATMHDRAQHAEEINAIVAAWTQTLSKADINETGRTYRIPMAAVRDVADVMQDPHMHERGMLEWVEHPDLGRVVLPTTPIRVHGTDVAPAITSPRLGQHNEDVYRDWLGLPQQELDALRRDGVI